MDNIVSSFEEIELTEAELEVIYGAQGIVDVLDLFSQSGTQVIFSGTIAVTTVSVLTGTVARTVS
jgi:hypothetical protein